MSETHPALDDLVDELDADEEEKRTTLATTVPSRPRVGGCGT
jgi:hypothetical protein